MIHERIGRAALRAYPPAVRQTRGPEMLGMVLDAGEHSGWAFGRECGSLVLGGLRERRAITARVGARRLIADSCCQAVPIWLTLWLLSALNTGVIVAASRRSPVQAVVLSAILACVLIGYERIAAVGGLVAIAAFRPLALQAGVVWPAVVLIPIVCLVVMVRAPRRRPVNPRRLLWLLPVGALAALQPHGYLGVPEVLALVSIGGLGRLFHDPRLAIACSLTWFILLTAHAGRPAPAGPGLLVLLAMVAAGVMLAVAAGRLWTMRRSDAA